MGGGGINFNETEPNAKKLNQMQILWVRVTHTRTHAHTRTHTHTHTHTHTLDSTNLSLEGCRTNLAAVGQKRNQRDQ